MQSPYGTFASLLAFHNELQKFLDSYLLHRERMGLNKALHRVDTIVFSICYRFVNDVPPQLKFSGASRATSLVDLQVLSAPRILRILSLFHHPGSEESNDSVTKDFIHRWISINPSFEQELCRIFETWSLTKHNWNNRNAAALRAVLEILSTTKSTLSIIKSLACLRGNLHDLLRFFTDWYSNSEDPSERGNLLASIYFCLNGLDQGMMNEFHEFVKRSESKSRFLLSDLLQNSDLSNKLMKLCKEKNFDELRMKSTLDFISEFPTSRKPGNINFDENNIMVLEVEEEPPNMSEDNLDDNSDVDALKDIYPHLGRYFCEKLLQACNWNLTQAVSCIMEGNLPSEVADLDFSAEEAPVRSVRLEGNIVSNIEKSTNELLNESLDKDLKSKLLAIYDEYNDDEDDAFDDGGRLPVDTGAQNLDEDDPIDIDDETSEEEIEEEEKTTRGYNKNKVPNIASYRNQKLKFGEIYHEQTKQQSQTKEAEDIRKTTRDYDKKRIVNLANQKRKFEENMADIQKHQEPNKSESQKKTSALKPSQVEFKPRQFLTKQGGEIAFVDINGERRTASGKLLSEEDELKPNRNRLEQQTNQESQVAAVPNKVDIKRAHRKKEIHKDRQSGADRKYGTS